MVFFVKKRTSTRARRAARTVRRSRTRSYSNRWPSSRDRSHLAILAVSAVIVFELIAIASQFSFKLSATGYAVADEPETKKFEVVRSYITNTVGCDNYLESNDPYSKGYVSYVQNGKEITAPDSCIDSDYVLEYYCDTLGRLNTVIGRCPYGCFSEGGYGYCG